MSNYEQKLAQARDRYYAKQSPVTYKAMQGEQAPRWFRRSVTAVRHTYSERRPGGRTDSAKPKHRRRSAEPRAGDGDPHLSDEHVAHGEWA